MTSSLHACCSPALTHGPLPATHTPQRSQEASHEHVLNIESCFSTQSTPSSWQRRPTAAELRRKWRDGRADSQAAPGPGRSSRMRTRRGNRQRHARYAASDGQERRRGGARRDDGQPSSDEALFAARTACSIRRRPPRGMKALVGSSFGGSGAQREARWRERQARTCCLAQATPPLSASLCVLPGRPSGAALSLHERRRRASGASERGQGAAGGLESGGVERGSSVPGATHEIIRATMRWKSGRRGAEESHACSPARATRLRSSSARAREPCLAGWRAVRRGGSFALPPAAPAFSSSPQVTPVPFSHPQLTHTSWVSRATAATSGPPRARAAPTTAVRRQQSGGTGEAERQGGRCKQMARRARARLDGQHATCLPLLRRCRGSRSLCADGPAGDSEGRAGKAVRVGDGRRLRKAGQCLARDQYVSCSRTSPLTCPLPPLVASCREAPV